MIQIIPHLNAFVCYGAATSRAAVNSGFGATSLAVTFGSSYAKHPVSVAGTFRHLVSTSNGPHPPLTVTLLVNGVATALTVTLDAEVARATDLTHEVAIAAGDDVFYQIAGVQQPFPGLVHQGTCVEFEGSACSYGITPFSGALSAGAGKYGGALGNGDWQDYPGSGVSNTYSICAVAGTLTRLDLKTYSGAPGAGAWVAAIRLNGVTQDGTAGTVDTRGTLTGAATTAVATFTLPLAVGDRVDVLIQRTGTAVAFANAHVACSVAFVPTVAGAFMLCGGSNDAVRADGPDWKWTRNDQAVTAEPRGEAPIGPAGLHVDGLSVERHGAAGGAGSGRGTVYTLRRSGTNTPIALTLQDAALTGQITGAFDFADGDAATIQADPFNTPGNNGFTWGLAVSVGAPPSPPATRQGIRRVRRAPHLSAEQITQFFARFSLDLEAGVGQAADPGADPQVYLRWSDDGGHTWRGPLAVSAGTVGAFRRRAIWRRLGRSRDRVFEVSMSDPVKWALLAASLDAAKGTS